MVIFPDFRDRMKYLNFVCVKYPKIASFLVIVKSSPIFSIISAPVTFMTSLPNAFLHLIYSHLCWWALPLDISSSCFFFQHNAKSNHFCYLLQVHIQISLPHKYYLDGQPEAFDLPASMHLGVMFPHKFDFASFLISPILYIIQLYYYAISLYLDPFQKNFFMILYTNPPNCFRYWVPPCN